MYVNAFDCPTHAAQMHVKKGHSNTMAAQMKTNSWSPTGFNGTWRFFHAVHRRTPPTDAPLNIRLS